MEREHLVLGLVMLIVVLLFVTSVGIGQRDSRADPSDAGGVERLEGLVNSMPGLGTKLSPDDVSRRIECFDRQTNVFESVDPLVGCAFAVPEGIDVVPLTVRSGICRVAISGQPDTFDQTVSTSEWDGGSRNVSLVGEGALIRLTGQCTVALESG